MCNENNQKEDYAVLTFVLIQQLKNSKNIQKKSKKRLIIVASNSNDIKNQLRMNRKIPNKMFRKQTREEEQVCG